MAQFAYRSVGRTQTQLASASLAAPTPAPPIGIRTPLTLATTRGGPFAMHTALESQVADNLRNLLLTNRGERVALHSFGADLRPLALELTAREDFEQEAMARIRSAAARWMPYVQLESFEAQTLHEGNEHTGRIVLRVAYSVPSAGIRDKAIEVELFVA